MDRTSQIVSQVLIRNGRFAAVGNNVVRRGGGLTVVDLKGRTVIPGIIDAHNHIVLVGNRPGWHTPLEHVFTIPDAIAALKARAPSVPAGEFITTVGPISAMQFDERRLPNADRARCGGPSRLHPGRAGRHANEQSRARPGSKRRGVMVAADGAIAGPAAGLALADAAQGAADPGDEEALGARRPAVLRAARHHHASRLRARFMPTNPRRGVANENTYTMHNPFLALAS